MPVGANLEGDFSGSGSGTLVTANVLSNIDMELSDTSSLAARITYVSASGINNNYMQVTGSVFVPRGTKPRSGWPTVAFAHPMTGIQPDCAPSLSRNLLSLAPIVAQLLRSGFAVTVPDYQGLGNQESYHPFLDSTTVGSNLIDSVRAARKLVRGLSDRWVAVGIDQGGQSAWAANELAVDFGGGLRLLGSVSIAPFSDVEGLADAASSGTLTSEQKLVLVQYLAALKLEYPDFDLDAYRRGAATQNWDGLLACEKSAAEARLTLAGQLSGDELRPASPQAAGDLRAFLKKTSLPQGVASAPMLVTYGGRDPVIPSQWTDRALVKACGFGDTIEIDGTDQALPGDFDLPGTIEWIKARLGTDPPVNDCPAFTASQGAPGPPLPPTDAPPSAAAPTTEETTPGGSADDLPTVLEEPTTTQAPATEAPATEAPPGTAPPGTAPPGTAPPGTAPATVPSEPVPAQLGPAPGPPLPGPAPGQVIGGVA